MKIIKTGQEARELLKQGIDTVANAVRLTLGPSGRTVIIGRKYQSPLTCDDGRTLADSCEVENEIAQLGVEWAKEAGRLTDKKVKDATSSTIVLLQEITNESFKKLAPGSSLISSMHDPIEIRDEINRECEKVCAELDKMAIPVDSLEVSEKVAFTSAKNRKIAQTVSSIFDKIGKDGVITFEDGDYEIESEIIDGFEIKAGFHSPKMANKDTGECILINPKILVTDRIIDNTSQLKPIIQELMSNNLKDIILIAPQFSPEILQEITQLKYGVQATIKRADGDPGVGQLISMNILAIRPPFFGDKARFEDLAIKTGGKFFDNDEKTFDIKFENLGSAKKVVIDKTRCLLLGGIGDATERVAVLEEELKRTKGSFDKEKLETRLSCLREGIGIIKVGAESDTERENLKHKVQDCIGAVRNARKAGYVRGGGLAFKEIAESLPESILTQPLKSVYNQIQLNAGGHLEISEDTLDAVEVLKVALRNACEIAGNVTTTEVAINDKNDHDPKKN